ncbi:MAG: hypothetical protein JSW17_03385 [Candidatus Omnitrophota bacterium]|nr:MAG: hypothetical protein JSW17_03385 [Candidatus Omnitrophota bacterium]
MKRTQEVIIGVAVVTACVWLAAMYILKYKPGKGLEKGNYAVFITKDWNFTEYEFSDKYKLDLFIDQVKKFYDKELEKDKASSTKVEMEPGLQRIIEEGAYIEHGEDLYRRAFEHYYFLKTQEKVSKPIKRTKLEEVPAVFNMPQDSLLTYIRDSRVIYRRDVYDRVKKGRKKKKEPLDLWKEKPELEAQRDYFR